MVQVWSNLTAAALQWSLASLYQSGALVIAVVPTRFMARSGTLIDLDAAEYAIYFVPACHR